MGFLQVRTLFRVANVGAAGSSVCWMSRSSLMITIVRVMSSEGLRLDEGGAQRRSPRLAGRGLLRMDDNRQATAINAGRLLNRVMDCHARTAIEANSLGFLPRCFVLTSLPHSRPTTNKFVRVNGNMTVSMVTTSDLGLPYGVYPRKLLISISTEAVRKQSPVITLGSSMSGYLKSLGLSASGGKYGTLRPFKDQARRLFGTFISVDEVGDRCVKIRNIAPVEEADVWWEPQDLKGDMIWEARITLSQRFFQQITESPIPLDWRVIQGLSRSPLAIDVYTWASYRRSKAKNSSLIPWVKLQMQFGAGYPETKRGLLNFKANFIRAAKTVKSFDREVDRCFRFEERGLLVLPGRPHVPKVVAWG